MQSAYGGWGPRQRGGLGERGGGVKSVRTGMCVSFQILSGQAEMEGCISGVLLQGIRRVLVGRVIVLFETYVPGVTQKSISISRLE